MDEDRFFANTMPAQTLAAAPVDLLKASLEAILDHHPPQETYEPDDASRLMGLMGGPTGAAYLFLRISARHSDLQLHGHDALYWAAKYVEGERQDLALVENNCGLACEKLSLAAVRACITGDRRQIATMLEDVAEILGPEGDVPDGPERFTDELVFGRAGALYVVRLVRHWVPECAHLVDGALKQLASRLVNIVNSDGGWTFQGRRFLGIAHGDMGIITQVVLSVPSLAPRLAARLEALLDEQTADGNWPEPALPKIPGGWVQFCYGAPGFVFALQALRPFFPQLGDRFDEAIDRARAVTWDRGLLKKEPSLCHGTLGNGLALPRGTKREHFLAQATPEVVEEARRRDASMLEPANYGFDLSVLMGYWPSAAWTWAVCDDEEPRMILFSDV